jgi:CBS domain-containing protein
MKSWRKAIVGSDATVSEAIAAIESGSIQVALVLDAEGRLAGIVTDGDIRRGLLRGIQLSGLAAVPDLGAGDLVARGTAAPDAAEIHQAASVAR